jgi:hypothetical protein
MDDAAALVLLSGLAVALAALAVWLIFRSRTTPAERERRRRLLVNRRGRMADGNITDLAGNNLFYNYSIAGVEYHASQDITALRDLLPSDAPSLFAPVTIKYLPQNPAHSIVLCEEWSGMRTRTHRRLG